MFYDFYFAECFYPFDVVELANFLAIEPLDISNVYKGRSIEPLFHGDRANKVEQFSGASFDQSRCLYLLGIDRFKIVEAHRERGTQP